MKNTQVTEESRTLRPEESKRVKRIVEGIKRLRGYKKCPKEVSGVAKNWVMDGSRYEYRARTSRRIASPQRDEDSPNEISKGKRLTY